MSYIDEISFQFFPAKIYEATPKGKLTLRQFLDVHKNPKQSTVETIEQIKLAAKNGDLKLKDSLKQNNLFSFVPSVILDGNGRAYSNIVDFNPIMVFEFDKINHAKELKERLFNNLKCVIALWISPSGKGCKGLIRIKKPTSIEEYKSYYCGLAYYLSQYEGFDSANFNPVLPLFLSYDRDILIREDAEEWTQRGGKVNAFKPYDGEFTPEIEPTEEDRLRVLSRIKYLIDRIVDNGHLQVRSTACALGGFVAQGYLDISEAEDYICELIEQNDYLSKGIQGYQKTAREMIRRGLSAPLKLEEDD